ncbi:hypothetical protein UG55_101662 [Frankia sp. EI5c]|uniref:hypothetical protein n=1 Tax=Frankia sp. EI5c TaxID=683316 RepID=UPI0007C3FEB1|nr:hypothetical protein [Frankia sp. EI5c]OAA26398.1 hypothetical protein UG55_101662 [Frankia sp. EI5c]
MATTRTSTKSKSEDTTPSSDARKPLYASVGAADLAVEKLLTLPAAYGTEVRRLSDRVSQIPAQAARVPVQVSSAVLALPITVGAQISGLQGRATELYNTFASRGEKRVAGIRRSPATEEAVKRTRTAASQTRAARTSTRRAAGAAGRAVSDAVTP